jgi:peroxiredoxin
MMWAAARSKVCMRYGTTTASGVIIFAFLYFLGMYRSEYYFNTAHTTATMVARTAPSFTLPEVVSGGPVDFENYRGRPVLLVFWTMADGECRRELSLISRVAPDFRGKGIGVVAIHQGLADNLKEFLHSNSIAVTSVLDGDESVSGSYRVGGTHKLVLVGSDGKIKKVSDNPVDESALRKWIDEAGA